METFTFYAALVLGGLTLYLGLRAAFGDLDTAWESYARRRRAQGITPERTPEWERRYRRFALIIGVGLGGFLLSIALTTYLLFF